MNYWRFQIRNLRFGPCPIRHFRQYDFGKVTSLVIGLTFSIHESDL